MALECRIVVLFLLSIIVLIQGTESISVRLSGTYNITIMHCNANVTCYNGDSYIRWRIKGENIPSTKVSGITGFTLGPLERDEDDLRQTLTIRMCYDEIVITCQSHHSIATISLLNDGYSTTEEHVGLWTGEIVGLVIVGVILLTGILVVGITIIRKRPTQELVMEEFDNPLEEDKF